MEFSLPTFLSAFLYYVSNFTPYGTNPDYNVVRTPQENAPREYDIIIVGGAEAGCILADRLTEIPSLSVALMTGFDNENAISDNPLLYKLDGLTNVTTVPQKRACLAEGGRCIVNVPIRLGGHASSNNMVYLRGTPEDYNNWAKMGNTDWSWKNVFPYFLKLENYKIQPLDRSPYHGNKGPMTIRYPRYQTLLRKEYIKAGLEFGWPQNDPNGERQYGIDYAQLMLDGPSRLSVAAAYLNRIAKRKNLTILKFDEFPKLLINKAKEAEGVEYVRKGKKYTVRAKREVILGMNTIDSPRVLMLSGIGPSDELKRLGIPQVCDLPVGKYYKDHPGLDMYFEIDKPLTITTKVWRSKTSATEFGQHGEGPLTTTGEEAWGTFNAFDRTNNSINAILRFFSWYLFPTHQSQNRQIITVRIVVLNTKSVGNLTIKRINTDLDDYSQVLINPNFYQEANDYAVMEGAAKAAIEFMKTPTMKKYSPKLVTDFQPLCKGKDQTEFIKCIIPNYTFSITTGVGTARMGSVVTQDQLFVRGVKNLRVVGDEVLPDIIKGSPTVATLMVAERAADLVKNYYGIKNLENPIYPDDYNYTSSSGIYSSNNKPGPGYSHYG